MSTQGWIFWAQSVIEHAQEGHEASQQVVLDKIAPELLNTVLELLENAHRYDVPHKVTRIIEGVVERTLR
jgi:hypothetical protein